MNDEPLKAMSLFSGAGGTCLAFKNAGFKIIVANEIDSKACETYRLNFPDVYLIEGCIKKNINTLKNLSVDCVIAGFPCQSFSVAGNRKGLDDSRGNLIDYVLDICRNVKPNVIFLENVKGLLSANKGNAFNYIKSTLEIMGYNVSYGIVNSFKTGYSRQIRERLYIVACKEKGYIFPDLKSKLEMADIDFDLDIPEFEYTEEKYSKYFSDKINLSYISKMKFYQIRRGMYIRELKNCPTLTANMGTGGHNVPIIKTVSEKIRKLSPRECFDLMGFPKTFKLPNIANCHLYKQSGNSVVVSLVEDLVKDLYKFLKK